METFWFAFLICWVMSVFLLCMLLVYLLLSAFPIATISVLSFCCISYVLYRIIKGRHAIIARIKRLRKSAQK